MNFFTQLEELQEKNNSLVCVGLDVDLDRLPPHILRAERSEVEKSEKPVLSLSNEFSTSSNNILNTVFEFNKAIIDATKDLVCCYKPNIPFYEALGFEGLKALKKTIEYLNSSNIPVILDCKRNDIGNTATKYAENIFNFYGAKGITINPYMGEDSITPFLEYKDKGVFILARTSNPGGKDFQNLISDGMPVYQHVIKRCLELDENKNVGFVIGATNPQELKEARVLAPNASFLIPGIGAQGGEVESTVKNSVRKDGKGIIINSSRGIIFASNGEDFAEAARNETIKLRDEINKFRN